MSLKIKNLATFNTTKDSKEPRFMENKLSYYYTFEECMTSIGNEKIKQASNILNIF